jgi:ADP-heptose:LPS heptosyltransferase
MMHVAAAMHKPIASIWGNTTPEFGMVPYYSQKPQGSHQFEIKDLSCRPCSKLGHSSCPKKHFKCMEMQDTKAIAQIINDTCALS